MTSPRPPLLSHRRAAIVALAITLLAFAVRVWRLDAVPPGWNEDELSNALVLAQKVLDGDISVYYVDATGHEALYHVLAAGFIAAFGYNAIGIRLLSAILGTLTVSLTYQVGRRLGGREVGLLAAAALAVSFWSLIYSRNGQRHVSFPVLMLASFYFFWRGLQAGNRPAGGDGPGPGWRRLPVNGFLASGLFMGAGFYTYFASRGVPLILLAFAAYLWLFHRALLRRRWRGILLTFVVALFLVIPLVVTVSQMPGGDARVGEVAVPLREAVAGNLEPLQEHVVRTLSMFHGDGDDEFLYNIPHRPVFGPVGAIFFWSGVVIAGWHALQPAWRALRSRAGRSQEGNRTGGRWRSPAAAFLLLWWLAGITPGFLSVPAGSLGHTIASQSAAYLLAALPISLLARRPGRGRRLAPLLALVLVATVAARDLPDYFYEWPSRGNVRFLYHANAGDVAAYLSQRQQPLTDFGISGLLAGPWERQALQIEMENAGVEEARPRWYDPQRAIFLFIDGRPAIVFAGYPEVETAYADLYSPLAGETAGEYELARVEAETPASATPTCFDNGLCLLDVRYDAAGGRLHLTWEVARPLDVPPVPLYSKPPPPGVYDGPRLAVFAHLLDVDALLAGDDGLWVNPETLRPGDVFRQQHHLSPPAETAPVDTATAIAVGLYDPLTQKRILTEDGRDHVRLPFPAP